MRIYLQILLIVIPLISFSQSEYKISGFSDEYIGFLVVDEGYEDEVFKKGAISILDAKNREELIKIESDELYFDLDKVGDVKSNALELPYGEQSLIISQDFNFDGVADLAIMDGQYSCYHGPSFQIYLQKEDSLIYSPDFSSLSHQYCGMFQIEYETETIHTMTKSGCCWHEYSEFKVVDGIPIAMKIVQEELHILGFMWHYIEWNRVEDEMVKQSYSYLIEDEIQDNILFSFSYENGKKMRLINYYDDLYYVFTDKENNVELLYLDDFVYSINEESLTFKNKNVEYKVSSNGIKVTTPKREIDMKALATSKYGSISTVLNFSFDNVIVE